MTRDQFYHIIIGVLHVLAGSKLTFSFTLKLFRILIFLFKLDLFLTCGVVTHIVTFLLLFYERDLKNNMDTVQNIESPSRQRSAVRRNLLPEFNEAVPTRLVSPERNFQFETPCQPTQQPMNQIREIREQSYGWSNFLKFWMCMIFLSAMTIVGVYHIYSGKYLMLFTKEIFVISVLIIICVVVLSVMYKAFSGRVNKRSDLVRLSQESSSPGTMSIPVKRTFSGDGSDIWSEFIRYFENVAILNQWTIERMRCVLLTTLRGQAETYAYGLSDVVLADYLLLKNALDQRFGHTALKESYMAEAKLRRKRVNESYRDFGQAIEDLYRRAHPGNRDFVEVNSLKTFLDNCSGNEEFRLAVKRTRPKTIQEAITAAMQEECIRIGEQESMKTVRLPRREVYSVHDNKRSETNQRYRSEHTNHQVVRRKCFNCGSDSHLRNRCPRLNSRQRTFAKRGDGKAAGQGNGLPPRQ